MGQIRSHPFPTRAGALWFSELQIVTCHDPLSSLWKSRQESLLLDSMARKGGGDPVAEVAEPGVLRNYDSTKPNVFFKRSTTL